MIKIVLISPILQPYRITFYEKLAFAHKEYSLTVFHGVPAKEIGKPGYKGKTGFANTGFREYRLMIHPFLLIYDWGMFKEYKRIDPDVLIINATPGNFSHRQIVSWSRKKQKKIIIPYDKSIWIIPKANPDGLTRDRRLNDNDIDLNRNFDTYNWKPFYYFFNILLSAGKQPFSEPETIAIKKLFESINKKIFNIIVLSLHSRGDLIIPGNKSLANIKLVSIIKNNSSYNLGELSYSTFGDLTEWLSNKLGIVAATIEFKSKSNIEINKLERIILYLLKLNFLKEIYNYSINVVFPTRRGPNKALMKLRSNDSNINDSLARTIYFFMICIIMPKRTMHLMIMLLYFKF